MDFEAGRLVWRLVTAGKQALQRDQADAQAAFDKTGKAAADASDKIDSAGDATDRTSKKSRESKGPLDEQAKSQKKTGDEAAEAAKKQRDAAAAMEKQRSAAKELAAVLAVGGIAVAAMVGLSVAKYTEFDKAMSQTSAATMATAQEQHDLGEAALEAGADTAYSASEAAAAEEELAKAGQSVSDIVGGSLNGALALAAAGQLQVARSAEIMATTLTQFRLPASQAAHVSDVLAAGAGKAQGSVDDLSLALSYVGPLAGSVGFSLNETAGAIAYFATQGIIGEKAGTSLRGVLAGLQAPSAAASEELKKYKLNMFDANGQMLSLSGIAEQLHSKLGGLTEQERLAALGRIFGNESLNAATLLYEGGAAKIQEWTNNVNDAGYAAKQAAMRQDNLAGDVEKLGGAFDTALIRTGSGANDVLREMVQSVTALVDWYGELPGPVQEGALVLGILTGAVLLASGATVGLRVKYVELKAALDATNTSFRTTALVGAGAGIALTGLVTILALVAQAQAEAQARTEQYATTLEEGTNTITSSTREMVKEALAAKSSWLWMQEDSAYDAAQKLGLSLDVVTEAALGNVDAMRQVEEATKVSTTSRANASTEYAKSATIVRDAVKGESGSIEEAIRVAEQKQDADASSVESSKSAAAAYFEAAEGASSLEDELSKLIDTINEANGKGQDAISANIDYQNALAKVDETIQKARDGSEGYALTLDTATQSGRDNKDSLVDLAKSAQDAAEKQFALDGNTAAYRQTLEDSRNALIQRATDLTGNGDAARALADEIFRIPPETAWKVIAETQDATDRAIAFRNLWDSIRSKTITLNALTLGGVPTPQYGPLKDGYAFRSAGGNFVEAYAGGGVRESHVAQMARAGAIRVWNEPETEGETYLPHAKSKRAMSEVYLAQTADLFGGRYIPASAMNADQPAAQPAGPWLQMGDLNIRGDGISAAEVLSIVRQEIRDRLRQIGGSG